MTVYDVEVVTGDKQGAGTDANVYITLFGDRGQTTKTRLKSKDGHNDFERNHTDMFELQVLRPSNHTIGF